MQCLALFLSELLHANLGQQCIGLDARLSCPEILQLHLCQRLLQLAVFVRRGDWLALVVQLNFSV